MSSNSIPDIDIPLKATSCADSWRAGEIANGSVTFWRRLQRLFWHVFGRQLTLLSLMAITVAGWIGRRRRPVDDKGCKIMLTGRFDSDNWILAHLGPLSASKECSRVWMVSTNPVPSLPKVIGIYPSKWLMKILGVTPARLLTFAWTAMWKRPHIVGGFHITVNAITAIILGRLVGARTMYFCVGGPAEIRDGGIHGVETPFVKMETADTVVESRFLKFVAESDMVITMGTRAVDFFRDKGINSDLHVVSGGIDSIRFRQAEEPPSYDLILTGRLATVKRIDVFLQAVKSVAAKLPEVRAVVVGDGELREELQKYASDIGIGRSVTFVGHQDNVETWLRKSKILVLTSDSEGLSLSMMEAMMCGLPAIVSNVGDLGDLVEDGINGFLVPRRSPRLFADRIIELLTDRQKLLAFSVAARRSALNYETTATIRRWDYILAKFRKSPETYTGG